MQVYECVRLRIRRFVENDCGHHSLSASSWGNQKLSFYLQFCVFFFFAFSVLRHNIFCYWSEEIRGLPLLRESDQLRGVPANFRRFSIYFFLLFFCQTFFLPIFLFLSFFPDYVLATMLSSRYHFIRLLYSERREETPIHATHSRTNRIFRLVLEIQRLFRTRIENVFKVREFLYTKIIIATHKAICIYSLFPALYLRNDETRVVPFSPRSVGRTSKTFFAINGEQFSSIYPSSHFLAIPVTI